MNDYIKNILPRIQKYGKQLNQQEVFVDKSWILIDEHENNHEYIFMRDGRLIMSVDGKVKEGKWELLPNGKLLVNRIHDTILLENAFIDKAIMILKISGEHNPFMVINPEILKSKDIQTYLEEKEKSNIVIGAPEPINGFMIDDKITITSTNIEGEMFIVGAKLPNHQAISGTFKFINDNTKHIEIKQGVITKIYFVKPYVCNEVSFQVEQLDEYGIQKGDKILNITEINSLEHTFLDTGNLSTRIFFDKNGIINKVVDQEWVVIKYVVIVGVFFMMIVLLWMYLTNNNA